MFSVTTDITGENEIIMKSQSVTSTTGRLVCIIRDDKNSG